jgi:nicotinate-nucleotide pyrophosphorylase (carboxylating)
VYWEEFTKQALAEDIREGDHTSLSCISPNAKGKSHLLIKDDGILAGVELACTIFSHLDPNVIIKMFLPDGSAVQQGQIAFELEGNARSILMGERLALNCMQRMSGIATLTQQYVNRVEGYHARILDTRKTTPLFRAAEKWAVRIGGGENHRFGLFDMIMIKDNHIDYAGGIANAVYAAQRYLRENNLSLKIEVESRTLDEAEQILRIGGVQRIMLDNFSIENTFEAVKLINRRMETEASGGINLDTVRDVASSGVDYISVGALTHSYKSLDLSLKAVVA